MSTPVGQDSLFYEFALPTDPALDKFDSGDHEVDTYFRTRRWFSAAKNKASPPTYVFRTDETGEVVGYAAVSPRNYPHPTDASPDRAKYLGIFVVGINKRFQGKPNPKAPAETYAASLFRILETMARKNDNWVGLCLWVRSTNARAICFYRKMGFVEDPGGPAQRDDQAPHISMRKLLNP